MYISKYHFLQSKDLSIFHFSSNLHPAFNPPSILQMSSMGTKGCNLQA